MAGEDTAVLDAPETFVAEEAAPLEETVAESVDEETGEDNAETGISETEVQARIDAALKEERDSYEEKQTQERYHREVNDAVRYRQQSGVNAVRNLAAWVVDRVEKDGHGKAEVLSMMNPNVINTLAADMESMAATEQWNLAGENFDSYMKKEYPDWKPSTDLVKSYERAMAARDPRRMFEVRWEFQKQALLDVEVPKLVGKQLETEKAKNKSAATVAATKQGDLDRAGKPGPTNVNGSKAPKEDASAIISNPNASDAQRRAAFEKAYGFKPNF